MYWVDDDNYDDAWWEEAYALANQGDDERVYAVSVGRETGTIARWYVIPVYIARIKFKYQLVRLHRARAGSASQGYPGGTVRRLVTINPPTRTRQDRVANVAWVVYEGLQPGVYNSW